MLRLLCIAAVAYGAAIPTPSCLEKCLTAGGVVGAAADLNFFKSVAVDINKFCTVYSDLLKCAGECSQDDLALLVSHTVHASYVCKEKLEEIKGVHDCLENNAEDPLTACGQMCQVTEHVPLRLDSTATAPVNPNVPAEGTAPLCTKQLCVLKCAREQLNKQCTGAGDLFKEVARHQVEVGWEQLQAQSENGNDTATQLVALSYLANIPEKCVFLTNLEVFDQELSGEADKKLLGETDFSNDTLASTVEGGETTATLSPVMDAPLSTESSVDESVHEQPAPALVPVVTESKETTEVAESDDSAVAMTPRPDDETPITGEGTGLVPSRPVTDEDKDSIEEDTEETGETTMAGHEGTVVAAAGDEETPAPAVEDTTEEEESAESTEASMATDSAMSTEDSEGAEMTTQAVIVVDDEQIDNNEIVTSTTEQSKVNGAAGSTLLASLLALGALVLFV